MDQYNEQIDAIFAKPAKDWTKEDRKLITEVQKLKGGRAWLKEKRYAEPELDAKPPGFFDILRRKSG